MRKLILSVVATLFLTTTFAADKPFDNPADYNKTYREITKLLNTYPNFEGLNEDVLVKVRIVVNENREIVVLSTNTTNSSVNYFIKNTLNYKKLLVDELKEGSELAFVVKFTK